MQCTMHGMRRPEPEAQPLRSTHEEGASPYNAGRRAFKPGMNDLLYVTFVHDELWEVEHELAIQEAASLNRKRYS